MSPADVLEAAADALFMYGRAIDVGERADGSMCVEGAICFVQGRDPLRWDLYHGRDTALAALALYLNAIPFSWNDLLPLTPENDAHVIDTLKSCAKALREVEA